MSERAPKSLMGVESILSHEAHKSQSLQSSQEEETRDNTLICGRGKEHYPLPSQTGPRWGEKWRSRAKSPSTPHTGKSGLGNG